MSENVKPAFNGELPPQSNSSDPLSLDGSLMQAAEARMRRALGLDNGGKLRDPDRPDSGQRPAERFTPGHNAHNGGHNAHLGHNGHKRRFVQDGEVPVTVVSSRRDGVGETAPHRGPLAGAGPNRLEAAEGALAHETAARQQAERTLAEAQATIHDLQTKLGHAELARVEAVEGLRREQETLALLRAELHECQERLRVAERAARPRRERAVKLSQDLMDSFEPSPADADPAEAMADKPVTHRGRRPSQKPTRSKLVRWWIKDEPRSS